MRLWADECVSGALVRSLRQASHDVVWSAEFEPGEADEELLARSVAENRILVTRDQDFGDLVFRQGRPAVGIVRIRLDLGLEAQAITAQLRERIGVLGEAPLRGRFTVMEIDRTRQRHLPAALDRS